MPLGDWVTAWCAVCRREHRLLLYLPANPVAGNPVAGTAFCTRHNAHVRTYTHADLERLAALAEDTDGLP